MSADTKNATILRIDQYKIEPRFWNNFIESLKSGNLVLWADVDGALFQYNAHMPNRDRIKFESGEDATAFVLRWS